VVIDLEEPLAGTVRLPGVTLVATEAGGRRLTYALDRASAAELVARVTAVAAVRDLAVVEPDIEHVVARLYTGAPVTDAP
jgi:ABC-2 type transport system ATP-binding protein